MERRGKACLPCRERKVSCGTIAELIPQTRCSGPQGDRAICSRCQQLSLSCLWLERAKRGQAQNSRKRRLSTPGSSTVTSPFRSDVGASYSRLQSILNRQMEFRDLVRTYFRTVHCEHVSQSIVLPVRLWLFVFHPRTQLLEACRSRSSASQPHRVDDCMHLAVRRVRCKVLIARFAGDASPGTLAKADEVYDEAFTRLLPQMYQRYGAVDLMVSPGTGLAYRPDHTISTYLRTRPWPFLRLLDDGWQLCTVSTAEGPSSTVQDDAVPLPSHF